MSSLHACARSTRFLGAIDAGVRAGALLVGLCCGCSSRGPAEIRVISDRTESLLDPLFDAFTKATKVRIRPVFLDEGLLARLTSRPTEADVVITKDADLLEIARGKDLLAPLSSPAIEKAVPAELRDSRGMYFSDSYRARAIFHSKDRVRPEELSTYEDLAGPRWKGRVCIRSGYHDYNVNLFGQMIALRGPAATRNFLEGLAENLARTPTGNDRDQARAISQGTCDVALVNSYYMGIMLSSREQRPWGEATRVFFPDQAGCGSYILRSGLALTRARRNVDGARKLLEYLVQPDVQGHMAASTFAYPVDPRQPIVALNRRLGQGQPQVRQGRFKICSVPLASTARQREAVIRMLDEIRFDRSR